MVMMKGERGGSLEEVKLGRGYGRDQEEMEEETGQGRLQLVCEMSEGQIWRKNWMKVIDVLCSVVILWMGVRSMRRAKTKEEEIIKE